MQCGFAPEPPLIAFYPLLLLACDPAATKDDSQPADTGADPAGDTGADSGVDSSADTAVDSGRDDSAIDTGGDDSAPDSGGDSSPDSADSADDLHDNDGDGWQIDEDCDDGDPVVNPGATESCDGRDNDCDGSTDEDVLLLYYADSDGDGYGDPASTTSACAPPPGYVSNSDDCDDSNPAVYGGVEVCDGVDNDCDGVVDFGRHVPTDFSSIQDAIDGSSSGDTICVAAGAYDETIDFTGKDLVIEGYEGADSTLIDGDGVGPVVRIDSGESAAATLRGFTVTGGEAETGAGLYVENADPTLESLIIEDNTCSGVYYYCTGTGAYFAQSDANLSGVRIIDNEASWPGDSGLAYGWGTGLYVEGGSPVFTLVDLQGNEHAAIATISYVTAYGVGAHLSGTDLTWVGGTVSGNTFGATGSVTRPGAAGGGIYLASGTLRLSQVAFADNDMAAYTASGGAIYVVSGTVELENVTIAGHELEGDSAAYGAGLQLYGGATTLTNVDIVGNTLDGGTTRGAGIYVYAGATVSLDNVGVVSNVSGGSSAEGDAVWASSSTGFASTYSNYYDLGGDPFAGVTDPRGSDGNIEGDPDYTDTSSADGLDWDLSLSAASACLDAGDPAILDVDGSTSDIGGFGGPNGAW